MVGFYRQKGVREGEVLAEEKKGLKKKKKKVRIVPGQANSFGGKGSQAGVLPH